MDAPDVPDGPDAPDAPQEEAGVTVAATADPHGIDIRDDIQGTRSFLSTNSAVAVEPCPTDPFCFPVDVAYELSFAEPADAAFGAQRIVDVLLRDDDAQPVHQVLNRDAATIEEGTYTVEMSSLPMKTYLHVENGGLRTYVDDDRNRFIHIENADCVRVGARSLHEQPAATVRAGPSPRALMRAVSCLGSALKTRSVERSFPTLRGHPPLIEVVDNGSGVDADTVDEEFFAAPTGLERTPGTADVVLRVPQRLDAVYAVSSLAFYLDAAVVPGTPAVLEAGGEQFPLTGPAAPGDSIADSANRILRHTFLLDVATRAAGFYPQKLHERNTIDAGLEAAGYDPLPYQDLYDASLGERTARYLDVPFDIVADATDSWTVAAHIEPDASRAEMLPFTADALAMVYPVTEPPETVPGPQHEIVQHAAVMEFMRDGPETPDGPAVLRSYAEAAGTDTDVFADVDWGAAIGWESRDGDSGASGADSGVGGGRTHELPADPSAPVTPPETPAVTDMWCAPGHALLAATPTVAACKRRLEAQSDAVIDVAVISNSPAMRSEADVADMYGLRDLLEFDVTLHEDLSADELRAVLAENHDLVHFAGHVSEEGLQASDGWLDAHSLAPGSVAARAFVLNACRSYEQGQALVEAGAIGGICTVSPVSNSPATTVGRTVAQLLNCGFTLGGALDIISSNTLTGRQYSIVGDPRIAIADGHGGTPIRMHVARVDEDEYSVGVYGYAPPDLDIGSFYTPYFRDNETAFLNIGKTTRVTVSGDDLEDMMSLERFPVTVEGDHSILWSDEFSVADVSILDGAGAGAGGGGAGEK